MLEGGDDPAVSLALDHLDVAGSKAGDLGGGGGGAVCGGRGRMQSVAGEDVCRAWQVRVRAQCVCGGACRLG